jgi:hypothetical protein
LPTTRSDRTERRAQAEERIDRGAYPPDGTGGIENGAVD